MITFSQTHRTHCVSRMICAFTAFTFLLSAVFSPIASAQVAPLLNLPLPGTMVMPTGTFAPLMIKGVNIHPDNALMFDFIMDEGDTHYNPEQFQEESRRLIRYFLASLTVPQEQMWVNLSPYEQGRIIPDTFGQTEMGRDLLAQDYMLKQLTSSLMYPEGGLGKKFWTRVRKLAKERYGTTEIPMDTYNKIWIVPETARIYEHEKGAFVVESKLKVMLEEDYLALEANQGRTDHGIGDVVPDDLRSNKDVTLPIVRELLIPEIEREVNEGKIFANLRQIHNAMILAKWYKDRLKESLLGQVYVNQGKVAGVNTDDPAVVDKIYDRYVEAFQKGVFDFIKEDYDEESQQTLPRRYFSGGINPTKADYTTQKGRPEGGAASIVTAGFKTSDQAGSAEEGENRQQEYEKIRQAYDQAAKDASYWLDTDLKLNAAAESIFDKGIIPQNVIQGADVLDVATGMGLMARAAAKHGAGHIVGVDISQGMLKRAEQAFAVSSYSTRFTGVEGNIVDLQEVVGAAEGIPQKFDVVMMGNIAIFLTAEELRKVLRQARNLLRDGGYVVMLDRSHDHGNSSLSKQEPLVWEDARQGYLRLFEEAGFLRVDAYVANQETDEDWGIEVGDLTTVVNENTVFHAQKPQVFDEAALTEFKAYAQTHTDTLHQRTAQNPLITDWQVKVGELYAKHKLYALSIDQRLDFVVNVLSDGVYGAVAERLKQLSKDYQAYVGADGRLSAQGYTRMNRELLEQEGRMTVKEYKYLRFGMGLVYDISDREQRILEQQYLTSQMEVELEHPGQGDLPVTASIQDLHGGARRTMALIGFALGLDARAYERVETLEDLKAELKKADIDLKNLPVTITGLNDKYDRGKRPVETFDLVHWLEETGKGRSITGNHDLWRLLAVLQVHRLFSKDEILSDDNKQHHPGFWAQDAFPHAMWGDVELAQILEERYNAAVDRYNTAVRENERIQQGLKRKNLEMEDVLLERIDLDAERGHYEKEVKRLKKLNAAIQAENAERSAQEQKSYHSLPNIFEKILHYTREQRELANALVRNVEQDFEVQNLPRVEFYEVNMDNYWRDPKVVGKALWDGRKFRLFDINILRALEQHGMMPFNQDAGGFDVTYKGLTGLDALQLMQEEVQEFFEPLKTLSDTEAFRKEMWDKIGEILSIVNDWYSDKTQYAKIAKFKKALLSDMGAAATQNGLWADLAKMTSGVGRSVGWGTLLILGHNESGKLTDFPWAFLNPELAMGLLQIDQSLSEGYENRGGILTMLKRTPEGQVTGLRLWGYAAPEATEITDLTRDERFLKSMTDEQRAMLEQLSDGEGFMRWYIQQTQQYLAIEAEQMLEEAGQQGRDDKARWAARVMGQEVADGASMSQNLEQVRRNLDYMQSRHNVSMFDLWTTSSRDSVFEGLRSETLKISQAVVRDYEEPRGEVEDLSRGIVEAYVVVANAFAPGDASVRGANQQMTTALTRFDTAAQKTGNDPITMNYKTEAANGLVEAVYQYQKFIKDHPRWLEEGAQPVAGTGEFGAGEDEAQPKDGLYFIFGTGVNGASLKDSAVYTDDGNIQELGHTIIRDARQRKWRFYQTQGDWPQLQEGDSYLEDKHGGKNMAGRAAKESWAVDVLNKHIDFSILPLEINTAEKLIDLLNKKGELTEDEDRVEAQAIKWMNIAVTDASNADSHSGARRFVVEDGYDKGLALSAFVAHYRDDAIVENIVLGSGIGEHFGGEAFFESIRKGLRQGLTDAGVDVERIEVILKGLVRSRMDWERELAAAKLTSEEIQSLQNNGEQGSPEEWFSAALSIGGTKIGSGLSDIRGRISDKQEILWQTEYSYTSEDIVRALVDQIVNLAKGLESGNKDVSLIKKIGIAFAGPLDRETGVVGTPEACPNLPFDEFNLREALRAELEGRKGFETLSHKLIIDILNDAAAAVIGEASSPKGSLIEKADAAQMTTIKQAWKKLDTGMGIVKKILKKHPRVKLENLWDAKFKDEDGEREQAIDVFAEAVSFVLAKIEKEIDDGLSLPEDVDFLLELGVAMMAVASTQVGNTFKQGNLQMHQALDEWASLKEDEDAELALTDEDWEAFQEYIMEALVSYADAGLRQTASELVAYNQKYGQTKTDSLRKKKPIGGSRSDDVIQAKQGAVSRDNDIVEVTFFGKAVKMTRGEAERRKLSYVEQGQASDKASDKAQIRDLRVAGAGAQVSLQQDRASVQNGGIDLNAQIAETIVEDNGRVFQMPPVTLEDLEFYMDAPGFEPVIINVTPPQPLPVILGYAKETEPVGLS